MYVETKINIFVIIFYIRKNPNSESAMAVSASPPESNGKDVLNEESESEELRIFRQQWLQELRGRKQADVVGSTPSLRIPPNVGESGDLTTRRNDHPLVRNGVIQGEDDMPSSLKKALDFYRCAVSHEQAGELDEALLLYRQAFRLVYNSQRILYYCSSDPRTTRSIVPTVVLVCSNKLQSNRMIAI